MIGQLRDRAHRSVELGRLELVLGERQGCVRARARHQERTLDLFDAPLFEQLARPGLLSQAVSLEQRRRADKSRVHAIAHALIQIRVLRVGDQAARLAIEQLLDVAGCLGDVLLRHELGQLRKHFLGGGRIVHIHRQGLLSCYRTGHQQQSQRPRSDTKSDHEASWWPAGAGVLSEPAHLHESIEPHRARLLMSKITQADATRSCKPHSRSRRRSSISTRPRWCVCPSFCGAGPFASCC